jgi:large-conductance mechanosensitive channel
LTNNDDSLDIALELIIDQAFTLVVESFILILIFSLIVVVVVVVFIDFTLF